MVLIVATVRRVRAAVVSASVCRADNMATMSSIWDDVSVTDIVGGTLPGYRARMKSLSACEMTSPPGMAVLLHVQLAGIL